jgi:hypothetical protein
MKRVFAAAFAGMLGASLGWALPTLQLDIPGGTYNTVDETTYSNGPVFTLRALLNVGSQGTLDTARLYYISAAIEPMLSQTNPPPNVGSFKIGTVSYTSGSLTFGKPPLNVPDTSSGNLAPHDAFPTYFAELGFQFDSAHTVGAYNTADGTTAPGLLYYYDFSVDVTNLLSGESLHFDLYNEKVKKGAYAVGDFAPFSHDAQSGHQVPDGGATVAMLGFALVGMGALRRIFFRV